MQRLLAFYFRQNYPEIKLLILNTGPDLTLDTGPEHARRDSLGLPVMNVKLINQAIDDETGKPYTNVGAVRRDALSYATGDIFCLFDDDDGYAPDHVERGVAGLLDNPRYRAWKPATSLYSPNGGRSFQPCANNLEASVFIWMDEIRKHGFRIGTGDENLSWFHAVKDAGLLMEDPGARATYFYCWGDVVAPHKQSGDMGNPANFENHKRASIDFGDGKPLTGDFNVEPVLERFCAALKKFGLDGKDK
jgi:hypothetical protein